MSTALIGKRLKALRDERGLKQDAIADLLGFKDRQTVSAIETGERNMKAEELLLLIEKYEVDLDYFTDPYRLVGEGEFSWRQSGRTVEDLKAYEATAGGWLALYRHEAPRVGRPAPLQRPKLPLTKTSSFEEAMAAGERVGEALDLGDVPAARLTEAMEREFGTLVLMVDTVDRVSGAACRLLELDAVVVNRHEVIGRRNFDLAHELFHIMTWEEMPPDYSEDAFGFGGKRNRVEQLADNFASALLMPARLIEGDWRNHESVAALARAINARADALQVSSQALKWRLVALGLLPRKTADMVPEELLRHNGHARDQNDIPPLFSRTFVDVLGKALDKGHLSRRRAARQLGVDVEELGDLFRQHNLPVPEGL